MDINLTSQIFVYTDLASFPVTGAAKTFYVADDTEKLYRWTGSAYVEVSSGSASTSWGGITGTLSNQTDLQTALNNKEPLKGSDDNYVTDAQLVVIGNTSGTNTGNETASTIGTLINGSSAATPNDTDLVATAESSVLKKITWTNVKAFLKTYFDTIYTTTSAVASQITTALSGYLTSATAASTYAPIASPTFTGTATTPAIIVSSETASRVAIIDASKNVKSADTTTYPSLTELAYVKGVTSAIQTQLDNKITNYIVFATTLNPADATTYYIGKPTSLAPATTDTSRQWKFTKNGTLTDFNLSLAQVGVNGSNQTVTVNLRNITDTTSTLLGTFTSDFGASSVTSFLFTGLNISVLTTKFYSLEIVCPTWTTNPTGWHITGEFGVKH